MYTNWSRQCYLLDLYFTCKKDNNLAKQCPNVNITTEYSLLVKSPINLTEDISYEETVAIGDTLEVAEFDVDIHGEDDKSLLTNTEFCSTNMKTSSNLYLSSDDSDTKVNHEQITTSKRINRKKTIKNHEQMQLVAIRN